MGNDMSTFLIISTNSLLYSPGEIIHGEIYIKLSENFKSEKLNIRIEGFEKYKINEGIKEYTQSTEIFNKSIILYDWENGVAAKGDYTFPFNFKLPKNIPGSTVISLKDIQASISYSIIASIPKFLNQKKEFWVKSTRQSELSLKKNQVFEKFIIKNFCCVNKGTVDFQMSTNKFEYNSEDIMRIKFNGLCEILPKVFCYIYRILCVKDNECLKLVMSKIVKFEVNTETVDLDLKQLEGRIGQNTSTNGKFVTCSYVLKAVLKRNCCKNEAVLPFQLNYVKNEKAEDRYSFSWRPNIIKCQIIEEGYSYNEAQSFYNSNFE